MRHKGLSQQVELVEMEGQEEWLLRPVKHRMCLYESLKDGTLDLTDLALMNEAIDVEAENAYRLRPTPP